MTTLLCMFVDKFMVICVVFADFARFCPKTKDNFRYFTAFSPSNFSELSYKICKFKLPLKNELKLSLINCANRKCSEKKAWAESHHRP
jgi:hypothetical protein